MARLPLPGGIPFHLSVLSTGSAAIDAKHAEVADFLGEPVGNPEIIRNPNPAHAGDGSAVRRFYEGGAIYWSESTGAHELRGDIFARYSALGAETSPLGLPTTGVIDTADGVGGVTRFQRGSIAGHDGTGTREVHGAINDKWLALGAEQGLLGFPLTDEQGAADGTGRFNDFQRGAIYWHPETGASEVHGDIEARWKQLGAETSYLGFPATDERDWTDPDTQQAGRISFFQRGAIAWHADDARTLEFPDRRVFRSGIGVSSVGGSVELIVTSAGTFHFKGHLHNSGLVGLFCTVGVAIKMPDANDAVVITHEANVGGTTSVGESRDEDWDDTGFNADVRARWVHLRDGGTLTTTIKAELGQFEVVALLLSLAGALAAISLTGGSSAPDTVCDTTVGQHTVRDGNNNTIVEPDGVRCR